MRVEDLLSASAERRPEKTALVCGPGRVTYGDLDARARQLAARLREAGLASGDRVGICLDHSIAAVEAIFATLHAGGAFFVVNPQTRPDRLRALLLDSGAEWMIGEGGTIARVPNTNVVPPDLDLAALIYTSGSTGEPKGVMLTHANLTFAACAISGYLHNDADDVIYNALPLAFTYGLGQITTAFLAGATVVLDRSFTYPAAILETLARERVTGLPLVPTAATMLLQRDLGHRPKHLRYITNAAAALAEDKVQRLREAFPSAQVFSMYGQTECQRVCYLPPDQLDIRPTSVGLPLAGTTALVVDENDIAVAPGTVGELIVAGPHVMRGYWNRPMTTAQALRVGADGRTWLHTGDLFKADDDGYLYFVARRDDIIKTRGEKVAPRQIEEVITRLPGVAEVVVFGTPDDMLGEAVVAIVVPEAGATLTARLVQRHCLNHLEPFMVPSQVHLREAVPLTTTGKTDRRRLREAEGVRA